MTPKALKELGVLGLLLLVLGAMIYRNMTAEPTASAPSPSNPTARDTPGRKAAPKDRPTDASTMDVKLDLLTAQPDSYGPPQRDPFRFKPKPAPVVKAPPPPPPQVVTIPQYVRPTAPPPQGDPPERLIRYTGYVVNAAGKPVAALSYGLLNSPAVVSIVALEGDVIEGRYRLLRVEPNAIEVVELSGEGRRARISRPQ